MAISFRLEGVLAVQTEKLASAKYLQMSEEDHKYELQANHLRRQQRLIGGSRWRKLKQGLFVVGFLFGCFLFYSYVQDSRRGIIVTGREAKEVFGSMVGELDQQKKIWEFVEN